MSRIRLTALLVGVGLAAAGLAPAAADAGTTTQVTDLSPARALHRAVLELAASPGAATAAGWSAAAEESGHSSSAVSTPRELAVVHGVGDLGGDRREEVLVRRDETTVVRDGRNGQVVLRRTGGWLSEVTGAGRVRLLWQDAEYVEQDDDIRLVETLQGLDARGRVVWSHEASGTVSWRGAGPASLTSLETVPITLGFDLTDAAGRPALLLGALTATETPATTRSRMDLSLLSLATGAAVPLPAVEGVGRGLAWAAPVPAVDGARTCWATTTPTGPLTRVALHCDGGEQRWSVPVPLRDPHVEDAGDFDGDRRGDLLVSTFGWERPRPREVLRGSRVLSPQDGTELAASSVDGLCPLRADIDGDGQPDFLELAEEDAGFGVQGVTLSGDVLYRRTLELSDSGALSAWLGLDVTGDGVADGLLIGRPERGDTVSLVVDGRTGRGITLRGAEDLLAPALRGDGLDLVRYDVERGRLRARVLAGDSGRPLLDIRVPGRTGAVSVGAAGTADLDRDGRRDLVLASRTDDRRLVTAFAGDGSVLWQTSEKAPPRREPTGVVVVVG